MSVARVARAPSSGDRPGAAHDPIHVEQHGPTRIAITGGRAQSFARDYFRYRLRLRGARRPLVPIGFGGRSSIQSANFSQLTL